MGGEDAVAAEDHEIHCSGGRCWIGRIAAVTAGLHNSSILAGGMRMSVAADARAESTMPTAVGAIPRDYNFAADILDRNLKAGRADKPAFIDPRGTWTYGQLADRVARFAASAARARRAARGARADRAARHHRLADRLSRLPQGRRRRRAGQHADDRGRLPLHAGRQPRARAGGVGGALSAIRRS